jgi:CDP-diacylglycerol--glycerol-3-phosphate 3-phosphatidyltransferase
MNQNKFNVEQFLRRTFKEPLNKVSQRLYEKGIRANQVTLVGLLGSALVAYLVAHGHLFIGGLLLALFAPLDAVDGALARLSGQTSRFGAFLDSFTDRYEELLVLAGLGYFFASKGNVNGVLLSFFAAIGSVMVSYARARAEALGFEAKVGILTRIERTVVMVLGLLLGLPHLALGIIALLANFTAWQRFFHVREQAITEENMRG